MVPVDVAVGVLVCAGVFVCVGVFVAVPGTGVFVAVPGVTGVLVAGVTGVLVAGVTGVFVAGVTGVLVAGVTGVFVLTGPTCSEPFTGVPMSISVPASFASAGNPGRTWKVSAASPFETPCQFNVKIVHGEPHVVNVTPTTRTVPPELSIVGGGMKLQLAPGVTELTVPMAGLNAIVMSKPLNVESLGSMVTDTVVLVFPPTVVDPLPMLIFVFVEAAAPRTIVISSKTTPASVATSVASETPLRCRPFILSLHYV
jgi:hypothetical protein